MKCKSPGAAKGISRRSPKSYQKQMERQRERNKLNASLKRDALKRRLMELERGTI
jgi:hypothetical protein